MIYYMIRHITTGEFMPELRRGKGYTHWNPAKVDTAENLKRKLIGTPRLFPSRKVATRCIVQWYSMPNSKEKSSQNFYGEVDIFTTSTPDGRKKEDLEVVEVNIEEVKSS